ncbi:MAG: magnesium transporter, partial [Acidobacteriota bacterium]
MAGIDVSPLPPTPHPPPGLTGKRLSGILRRLLQRNAAGRIVKLLARERPEDVATALRRLVPAEQFAVFDVLLAEFPDSATEVLTELDHQERAAILGRLPTENVARLLQDAAVDDAVFVVESLPVDVQEKVLEIVDLKDELGEVQAHLAFGDDSAGRIMTAEYLALAESVTVVKAVEHLRQHAGDVDMISYLYVIDRLGHLLGVTSIRQLLLADPETPLGEVMQPSLIKVRTETDQEEVAQLAARYDLLAIPVVDDDNKLAGIVTVDDILDVFKEEATEDFYKLAGTTDEEIVYQEKSFKVAGIRLPWLLVNLVGLVMAGLITRRFEETFQLSLLIGFIPVVMGTAGNIGSQTATIAVRGLATGRLNHDDGNLGGFLWQQIKVGVILGVVCGG